MKHRFLRFLFAVLAVVSGVMLMVPGRAEAHGTCRYVGSDEEGTRQTTCAESLTCYAVDGVYPLPHGTEFRVDDVFDGGRYVYGYVPGPINRGCVVHNGWFH